MASHQAVFDLRGPQVDARQVWSLLSPILTTAARTSFTVALAHTRQSAPSAVRHEVERIIDGFV